MRLFVHVSTDEVYGDGAPGVASSESAVLEPTNPYAASKAGAEYLVKAYQRSFALPAIITRGNNVYGPHQYPEKVVPKFIHQLTRGRPVTLHGAGANTRNYLFVEDAAAAFDVILHRGVPGETYNMGSDNEIANVDVARALLRMLGLLPAAGAGGGELALPEAAAAAGGGGGGGPTSPPPGAAAAPRATTTAPAAFPPAPAPLSAAERQFISLVKDRPFNDLRYSLDCGKLFALGWRERVTWADGLRRTLDWYLQHPRYWPRASDMETALVA